MENEGDWSIFSLINVTNALFCQLDYAKKVKTKVSIHSVTLKSVLAYDLAIKRTTMYHGVMKYDTCN